MYEGQGPSVVATGQVYPYIPDATSHFEVIMEGCMRVQVDRVLDGFTGLPLPVPGPYLKLLGDAHGSFTQWPKSSIILEEVKKFKFQGLSFLISCYYIDNYLLLVVNAGRGGAVNNTHRG